MRYISASDMHSNEAKIPSPATVESSRGKTSLLTVVLLTLLMLVSTGYVPAKASAGALIDSVAAFVDDQAITVSELRAQYEHMLRVAPDITMSDVLETMINRILLVREAKKYRIEAPSQEEILSEYIDLKVRAFIRISDGMIEDFYWANESRFAAQPVEDVRDEIEQYLSEKEVNARLKDMIDQLRRDSYIRVNRAY